MLAPLPGICLLIILIEIQTACVRVRACEVLTREWVIGLHGLFCHLYFSALRDYLRNNNWLCFNGFGFFFIKMRFVFVLMMMMMMRDVPLLLCISLYSCVFWQMKGLWATTMKIFLFLDSDNVFENKVDAALLQSLLQTRLFILFLTELFVF